MRRDASRNRPAAIASLPLSLASFLAMAVAPSSPARAEDVPAIPAPCPVAVPAPAVKPYYAYRPVYAVPNTRPLYLSNYAGANYPSRAPGAAVTPTEFRVLTGRDGRPRWNWFGLAR